MAYLPTSLPSDRIKSSDTHDQVQVTLSKVEFLIQTIYIMTYSVCLTNSDKIWRSIRES